MMILVIGPNGSGKSVLAEKLAIGSRTTGRLLYIATMIPEGDDGATRVARHRAQREGLGFETIESPLAGFGEEFVMASDDTILLEDVSNLVANLRFSALNPHPVIAALSQVRHLRETTHALVTVTIGGLTPQPEYSEETLAYLDDLNEVNARLMDEADHVISTGPHAEAHP